jgi:hypothetical protein
VLSQVSPTQYHRTPTKTSSSRTHTTLAIHSRSRFSETSSSVSRHALTPPTLQLPEPSPYDYDPDSAESSSTDDDEFETLWHRALNALINRNKRILFKAIIKHFAELCDDKFLILRKYGGEQTAGQASHLGDQAERMSKVTKKRQKLNSVKTVQPGDDGGDDYDDDDPNNRRRKPIKKKADVDELRYACPYFQRNSQNPRLHRACLGPGFLTIHRLKYHLPSSFSAIEMLINHLGSICIGFITSTNVKDMVRVLTPSLSCLATVLSLLNLSMSSLTGKPTLTVTKAL